MSKLRQIAYASFVSTGRYPRRWILALIQVIAFSLVGELARPHWLASPLVFWPLAGAIILGPVTALLWLEIEAADAKPAKSVVVKVFIQSCLTADALIFCSMVFSVAARLLYPNWIFLAVFSSLVAATATLAMLYTVLCGQPFDRSIGLAMDTWNKKTSLAASSAFILILAQGVSFALVHGVWINFLSSPRFPVFTQSATIWVLLVVVIFFVVLAAAFLNCFLVLLFLETIKREKDPEAAKKAVENLMIAEAGRNLRTISSVVEHLFDVERVGGSIPPSSTIEKLNTKFEIRNSKQISKSKI
jgi:hypothetical protein